MPAAVRAWIPAVGDTTAGRSDRSARIDVRRGGVRLPFHGPGPAHVEVLGLRGWITDDGQVELRTRNGAVGGAVDLPGRTARIGVADRGQPSERRETFAALTVAAALLLGRQCRILLHAAAFIAPDGGTWLLVGDSRSGKSSTCATLVRGGWRFLADDQVVIGARRGDEVGGTPDQGLRVEGWPRSFNLDRGFRAGTPTGIRSPVDAATLGPGRWQRSGPLAGILFPRVEARRRTALEPMSGGEALEGLIRQSPWLLADPVAAAGLLALMRAMVELPVRRLRLGLDCYGVPGVLHSALGAVVPVGDRQVEVAREGW